MTTGQQALLELLNISAGKESNFDFSALSIEEWRAVYAESCYHSVVISAFDGTENISETPELIKNKWLFDVGRAICRNEKIRINGKYLDELLSENGLNYIILKGFASASYYQDPDKRMLGDLDFLVASEQRQEVEELLVKEGFNKSLEGHSHHTLFQKEGADFEMHHRVAGIPDGKAGKVFSEFFADALSKFIDDGFHNPLPEIHGAVILLHTIHHMTVDGLGLRHLCDFAYFVDKTAKEPFWEEKLLPLFKESGTLCFAAAITKTCAKYLKTACPDWAEAVPDSLCDDIIFDIMSLGTFGRKNEERRAAGRMTVKSGKKGKLAAMLHTLHNTMHTTCPILGKVPILYPFCFVYRIIKYLVLSVLGKKKSILKISAEADSRNKIYDKLHIFEVK